MKRVLILLLDSVGIGEMPDAASYGDSGADTLGNTARHVGGLELPSLEAMGLGSIHPIEGVAPAAAPRAGYGKMAEQSAGKDTTTGHWEIAGVVLDHPFSTWPDGFPAEILDPFRAATGRGVLGNKPASGTVIIEELGPAHMESGDLIVYTSADSVFQIAAHEEVVPLDELYAACEAARRILDPHRVARVIARPFVGAPGSFTRTYNRKDFSLVPPAPTLLDHLTEAGIPVVGIGKIKNIFAERGVTVDIHTDGNTDGIAKTMEALRDHPEGLVFTNLVDFDMRYGHRRNPEGYAEALREVDAILPALEEQMGDDTLLIITADHGCDPTYTKTTDHTREYVPLLVRHAAMGAGVDLGTRPTFADLGATVAEALGMAGCLSHGTSFLDDLGLHG